jgi:hypothetical protein
VLVGMTVNHATVCVDIPGTAAVRDISQALACKFLP